MKKEINGCATSQFDLEKDHPLRESLQTHLSELEEVNNQFLVLIDRTFGNLF